MGPENRKKLSHSSFNRTFLPKWRIRTQSVEDEITHGQIESGSDVWVQKRVYWVRIRQIIIQFGCLAGLLGLLDAKGGQVSGCPSLELPD